MVYETDFYTTRRPYSRPTVTSYSVTRREVPWHKVPTVPRPSQVAPCFTVYGTNKAAVPTPGVKKLPGLGKGQTYHRNIPAVGHMRLVQITPSVHTFRSKPSVLISEIDRIHHKIRPSLAYQPVEDYLNSHPMVSFDDETRSIRAKTAEILKRIHTPVPRAQRPMPLPGDAEVVFLGDDWYEPFDWYPEELGQTRLRLKLLSLKKDLAELNPRAYYSHSELPITDRITSDNYIKRLLSANRDVARDINIKSHLEDPGRHYRTIGQGHLACVSFAGGRPISKRRNLVTDDPVRDDINVLSHYGRFRAAAALGTTVPPTEPEFTPHIHRPPTKTKSGSWKSNAPKSSKEHKAANLTAGDEFDAAQDRKQRRRDAVEAAAAREVEEEKRRKQEHSRQEDLALQAESERQKELERRAVEEAEALVRKEEEARIEAERQAREEEERKAREEEERLAKEAEELRLLEEEEAAKKLKEEEDKKAKKAKKEAEKKAKEEAERKAKEEEEKRIKEEAERKAREDEEARLKKEEEERKAKEEEEERLRKEEEEERRAAEEAAAAAAAEEAAAKAAEEAAAAAAAEEAAAKAAEEAAAAEQADSAQSPQDDSVVPPAEQSSVEESETPAEEVIESAEEPVVEEPAEPVASENATEEPAEATAEEVLSSEE